MLFPFFSHLNILNRDILAIFKTYINYREEVPARLLSQIANVEILILIFKLLFISPINKYIKSNRY